MEPRLSFLPVNSSKIRRFLRKEEKEGADMKFSPKAETEWSEFLRRWPVGQVVKTAASHAVNIGSNPVRVTKTLLDKANRKQYNAVCSPVDRIT